MSSGNDWPEDPWPDDKWIEDAWPEDRAQRRPTSSSSRASLDRSEANADEHKPPVEVPRELLSHEAFEALVDSFILREGTDYGVQEIALETKRKRVLV